MLKIAKVGKGAPIVFIHGWGVNSGVWQPCVDILKESYSVITVDLPGFGVNVDNTVSPYSIENIAHEIAGIIDEPSILVGWSLGGLVATELALQFPDKVKALVNVASSPCFVAQENWAGIQPDVLEFFFRQLQSDTKKTINNFLKIQAMGSESIRQDIKLIRDLVMQYDMPTEDTLHNSLLLLEKVDQREQLTKIFVPHLRMYGKLDGLVPKASIEKITALSPNSDVYIFDKASHAPFISDLNEFTQSLDTWIQRNLK